MTRFWPERWEAPFNADIWIGWHRKMYLIFWFGAESRLAESGLLEGGKVKKGTVFTFTATPQGGILAEGEHSGTETQGFPPQPGNG